MYIITLKIKNIKFKRCVDTNNINTCVEEIPLLLQKINEEYYLDFTPEQVVIEKIKRYN